MEPDTNLIPLMSTEGMPLPDPRVSDAWEIYSAATVNERALYEEAMEDAHNLRSSSINAAVEVYHAAIRAADDLYQEAQDTAWKTFFAATDQARRERDEAIDSAGKPITDAEIDAVSAYPTTVLEVTPDA